MVEEDKPSDESESEENPDDIRVLAIASHVSQVKSHCTRGCLPACLPIETPNTTR